VVNAIDAYLAYRAAHDEETTLMATAFRGLNPGGPLFLTGEGAFTVRFKTAAALAELDARVAAGIGTSRNEVILKLVAAKAKEMLK
jgi:hypothetical protein